MSKLLFNEHPIVIDKTLAETIGLPKAIVVQQMWYWMESAKKIEDDKMRKAHYVDGRWWTWHTIEEWCKELPFFSKSTIRRAIESLEEDGIVFVGCFNKAQYDRTKWYSVDADRLAKIVNKRNKC